MDLVRTELLPPLLMADMQREARRWVLAEEAAAIKGGWAGPALAAQLGALLVRAGCRLESAGRRRITATPLMNAHLGCGCGE